ncbi:unnamed protein product [Echinostoma caproni]|uniref:Mucin-like glycoprotein n=1 Tax=Echinostoma caproni TaxID=27848 RepID=A0A183ADT2_9TREM|nr:unnamed protein product [Echinostoma caproni]
MAYYESKNMKSNIVKFLLITVCISGIVAENCEDVTASSDARSFVVKRGISGCQYRVKPASGKSVKVFVNSTSGTDCVYVASGDKSEALCPTGATTTFTSIVAVDKSAESGGITTSTSTAEPTAASTDATSQSTNGKDEGDKTPSKGEEKVTEQGGTEENQKKDSEEAMENEPEADSHLIRQARDTTGSGGSVDVTGYYMLGKCSTAKRLGSNQIMQNLLNFLDKITWLLTSNVYGFH